MEKEGSGAPEFFHDILHEIGTSDPFHLEATES